MKLGLLVLGLVVSLLVPGTVMAATPAQNSLGAVFYLKGTSHVWIADDQGVLHWGGDTRALAGKTINWGLRNDFTADQLRSYKIGDPWLSAGLVKTGDPIYLVKWESDQPQPTLLQIQSITDVELFGINGSNYGSYVMDQATWEQRFPFKVALLARGTLASAVVIPVGGRTNPIARGQSGDLNDGWRLSVVSVTPDATKAILAENRFNDQPSAGAQFYMVRIRFTRTGDGPKSFSPTGRLRLLGSANVPYSTFNNSCGVIPDGLNLKSSEAYPGGTIEGNLCWQVPSGEAGSLVMYDESGFGNSASRVFFALR